MIKELEKYRIGVIDPQHFMVMESHKRARNLTLSNHRDVENVHSSGVLTLDLDAEGRYLLSGCSDGSIYIHDLYNFTGSPSFTANVEQIIAKTHKYAHKFSTESVQWYPQDSGLFITGSMDKSLKIWDSNHMRPVETVKFDSRIYQVHMSTNSASKCLIAVAGTESIVRLVDLTTGSCTHELRGHESSVLTCRWSPREEYILATGGCDGRIILWDTRAANIALRILDNNNGQTTKDKIKPQTKKKPHTNGVNGLCFTANGYNLISLGWDATAKLWTVPSGKRENIDYGKVPLEKRKTIQFDVAGCWRRELVYIPSEGKILVFEVQTGKLVKALQGHYNQVNACIYNSLHQEVYSAANDRSILIWTPDLSQETAYKDHVNLQSVNASQSRTEVTQDVWSSDEDD